MKFIPTIFFAVAIVSCSVDKTSEVNRAMRNYDKQITHLATDSIAQLYMQDGELSGEGQNSVVGRDSIGIFLKSFADSNVKVIRYISTTDSTLFKNDAAIQYGSYNQIVKMPSGDTLKLGGNYIATWVDNGKGEWLIKKMFTHNYKNLK